MTMPADLAGTALVLPAIVAGASLLFWTWLVFRVGRRIGHRARGAGASEGARRHLAGRAAELWAPFDEEFPGTPDDAWFLGAPIDYVVFDGLADGDLEEIVFVEVKSGAGKLTRRERQIRDAVLDGRVAWMELRREPSGSD